MKISSIIAATAVTAVSALTWASPAAAQATRTWVSGVGDDANPCSRTAPCKTFAGAISKTGAGGEINCLDPGGYGAVTITKSITIDCTGTLGSILASGTNGVVVNGSGINVVLRGIQLTGSPPTAPGLNGIRFIQGNSLLVENVLIQNFTSGGSNGFGIVMATGTASELFVHDTTIAQNGVASPAAGGGIEIAPAVGGSAVVVLRNVRLLNSGNFGMRLNTTNTTAAAGIVASLEEVEVSGASQGLVVFTPASTTTAAMMVANSTIAGNSGFGIVASGGTATARVGDSTITGNGTGVLAVGGGAIRSYGTNRLNGNGTDGTFTAPLLPEQ